MHRFENTKFMNQSDFLFHMFPYSVSGRTVAPHCHEFVEFVYIYAGSGSHEYKGQTCPIGAGDVFVIEPEAIHAFHVGGNERLELFNVMFQPSFFTKELGILFGESAFVQFYFLEPFVRASSPFPSSLRLMPTDRIPFHTIIDQMYAEYTNKQYGYRTLLKTKLMECFIFLSRCYKKRETPQLNRESPGHNLMDLVQRFIEEHYAEPLDHRALCQMCGMSESGLRHKFKEHTGASLLDYRNNVRIGVAKQLLLQTDRTVADIATEVGFNDISFFNRMFKERSDMSPRQFRAHLPALVKNHTSLSFDCCCRILG